jgi:hypothetical protein
VDPGQQLRNPLNQVIGRDGWRAPLTIAKGIGEDLKKLPGDLAEAWETGDQDKFIRRLMDVYFLAQGAKGAVKLAPVAGKQLVNALVNAQSGMALVARGGKYFLVEMHGTIKGLAKGSTLGSATGILFKVLGEVPPAIVEAYKKAKAERKLTPELENLLKEQGATADQIQRLRTDLARSPKTPSDRIRRWVRDTNGYGYIDPETNAWVPRQPGTFVEIHPAHIYPGSLIRALPGFEKLTWAQQDWLLNHPDNFLPLTKQWNSSMGNMLADDWVRTARGGLASKAFVDSLREAQQAFESFAKEMISFWLGE